MSLLNLNSCPVNNNLAIRIQKRIGDACEADVLVNGPFTLERTLRLELFAPQINEIPPTTINAIPTGKA